MDWNHRWSIHAVDATVPSGTSSVSHAQENRASSPTTKSPTPPPAPSLLALETSATQYLRAALVKTSKTKNSQSLDVIDDEAAFWRGNFVQIRWIKDHVSRESAPSATATDLATIHETQRSPEDDSQPCMNTPTRYLSLDVFIDDKWSATAVLCFYTLENTPIGATHQGLDFLLARGRVQSYQIVWAWLTLTTTTLDGLCYCQWIASQPVTFSTDEMKEIALAWIDLQLRVLPPCSKDTSRAKASPKQRYSRPLRLTYTVPNETTALIDSIDVEVPVTSLEALYRHLVFDQTSSSPKKRRKVQLTPPHKKSKVSSSAVGRPETEMEAMDGVRGNRDKIVQALDAFLLREFRMDVTRLELVRVQSAVATLTRDGRVQPTRVDVLAALQRLMQQRSQTAKGQFSTSTL